nr:ethylene-responsive transcription factor ERF062-like [Ipomoea trifida]
MAASGSPFSGVFCSPNETAYSSPERFVSSSDSNSSTDEASNNFSDFATISDQVAAMNEHDHTRSFPHGGLGLSFSDQAAAGIPLNFLESFPSSVTNAPSSSSLSQSNFPNLGLFLQQPSEEAAAPPENEGGFQLSRMPSLDMDTIWAELLVSDS